MNRKKPSDTPLAYKLRSTVQVKLLPDDQPVLILSYPLKAAYINRFWKPVLNSFVSLGYVSLDQIAQNFPEISLQQIEFFLNDLTRKGFLKLRGIPFTPDNDLPFVSIIIPVRNRPKDISACLTSLNKLDYPTDKTEIIVVDDASEDTTPEMINRFPNVRLIALTEHRQVSFCRNRAARVAKGDILAFIDSDCLADPSWLRELVPAFRDDTLDALGGLVDSYYNEKSLDQYEKVKSSLKIGSWFKRSIKKEHFFYVPFCNILVRRKKYLELGGLKEDLHVGEDVDFCWRLQDSNGILEYRPMGRIFHKHRNSLLPFCTRRFDYGTSEPLLQKRHPHRIKKLFLPPHELFFWMLLFLSLNFKSSLFLLVCAGIFISDIVSRKTRLNKMKLPIRLFAVLNAVTRSYLSFLYHCASFVSRYYLIPGLIVWPLLPNVFGVIVGLHLAAGLTEYVLKKACINPISFLFYFSLEQISYQAGVIWGCFLHGNANPVLPRIVYRRDKA